MPLSGGMADVCAAESMYFLSSDALLQPVMSPSSDKITTFVSRNEKRISETELLNPEKTI